MAPLPLATDKLERSPLGVRGPLERRSERLAPPPDERQRRGCPQPNRAGHNTHNFGRVQSFRTPQPLWDGMPVDISRWRPRRGQFTVGQPRRRLCFACGASDSSAVTSEPGVRARSDQGTASDATFDCRRAAGVPLESPGSDRLDLMSRSRPPAERQRPLH